jgi:RHS repeat-associated protein
MSDPKKIEAPKVTLPSGGGGLRGIGEPFKAQDFTGAAGFSVPLPMPSARGLSPALALQYNSGNGNGPFGLGFALPIDSIVLQTSKGVPRYDGTDTFVSAAGELIVSCAPDQKGNWLPITQTWTSPENVTFAITQYRPRIEGSFDRITQWRNIQNSEVHWRIVTSENITHILGDSMQSRIADPQNPLHVFEWLISESQDVHGNIIRYAYRAENDENIPDTICNVGRDRSTQRYLWQVLYGNYDPSDIPGYLPSAPSPDIIFAFQVCFDYGQMNPENPNAAWGEWECRPDPFSSYKTGFEIRTWRRCKAAYFRQQFVGENGGEALVTQALLWDFASTNLSEISIITRMWQRGYRPQYDSSNWTEETPALELTYQEFAPTAQAWKPLQADAPGYLGPQGFMAVDIYGEGIDGLLLSDSNYTAYLRPLGHARFASGASLPQFPNYRDFGSGALTFTAVEGNNMLDLVVNEGPNSGYFAAQENGGWNAFQKFARLPEDFSNPDKEWVDIDGSGRPAILLYDQETLKTYASDGALGYEKAQYTRRPALFPSTNDSGATAVLTYADVFGDGLPHRVRIQNGRIDVWPCLGHGKFGNCVTFSNSPTFPQGLDVSRLQLIDTDGSGALDIVYFLPDKMRVWVNQNGNAFAPAVDVILPSTYGSLSQVTPGDFTGYGTASLLLTQVSPQVSHLYYDFAGSKKPYLLIASENGLGGKTEIAYTTSVLEYFRDRAEGRVWHTRLPFPVHVTQKIVTTDLVTGSRFTAHSRYHDGYFDPIEREFRGFGFVETWDTEDYEAFQANAILPEKAAELLNKNLFVPPIHTKSWFLTGAYLQTPEILAAYEKAFFQGDPEAWQIPAFSLDLSLQNADAPTMQQVHAALAGHNIRTEVYACDGSDIAQNPYTVSSAAVEVLLLQPQGDQRYCCLQVIDSQSLAYNYERNPADPQITQSCVLSSDLYGHPLLSASVAYPRRIREGVHAYPEQQNLHISAGSADYINTVSEKPDSPLEFWQIIGINWQSKSYEIGCILPPDGRPFTPEELRALVEAALANPVSSTYAPTTPWSNLLTWQRSFYWNADQSAALPGGQITPLTLLHSSEMAVMTPQTVSDVFGDKVSDQMLQCDGGYVLADGYWWNPGLVQYYYTSAAQYYLPWRTDNPLAAQAIQQGTCTAAGLDVSSTQQYDPYYLNIVESAVYLAPTLALRTRAEIDYLSLQPWRITDANENVQEVLIDPLGRVIASTTYGMLQGVAVGDLPLAYYKYQPDATFDDVIADPAKYLQGATQYFYTNWWAWQDPQNQQPVSSVGLQRMRHVHDDQGNTAPAEDDHIQTAITYSNGLGSILQAKARVGPGPITLRKGNGTIENPEVEDQTDIVQDRWLVTGRVIYNNKGQPTEQYDPYFSATPYLESQSEIIAQKLVPPPSITQYDPAGRVIKVTTPKGFFAKTAFTPWLSQSFDANDTVLDSAYYQWFQKQYPTPQPGWEQVEWEALQAAVKCYNTPASAIFDNQGRAIRSVVDNLGAVGQNAIPELIAKPDLPATVWQQLIDFKYLALDPNDPTQAWVTADFQPFVEGFSAIFQGQFPANGRQLEAWLSQQCLTSIAVYDAGGNVLQSADPRLFADMVQTGTPNFNFEFAYDMAGTLLRTQSVDAGTRWNLNNIYGNTIAIWDARGFCTQPQYDSLQRTVQTTVTGGDGSAPLNNIVNYAIYGESVADAAQYNLNGQIYQHYDSAGCGLVTAYGLGGQALATQQQVRPDYKSEPNWTADARAAMAQEPTLTFSSSYDALGNILTSTTPDGSMQHQAFSMGGRMMRLWQEVADTQGNLTTVEVEQILGYDANGNRTCVRYGNGVQSRFTYDALTQALLRVHTTRLGTDAPELLRTLSFTYDPVGNKLSQTDEGQSLHYHDNQVVSGTSTYSYDPLYRLIGATGKALPGLNKSQAGTDIVRANIGHHYAPIADLKSLENYARTFGYDAGGNLVLQRHKAASGNWTQVNVIADGSNRLRTQAFGNPSDQQVLAPSLPYDANGNLLRLYAGSKAVVAWNSQNNIANVTLIERSAETPSGEALTLNDAEYYVYDGAGQRTRKVTERMQQGGTVVAITDKFYFGNYEIKRVYTQTVGDVAATTLVSEKHSLHAIDGNCRISTTDTWIKAPDKEKGPQTGATQTRFMLHDGLDSVSMELTENAEVISYEEYFPYGGTAFTLARSQIEADSKEYRFTGKECDAATGLYYYGARYYATWQCRWMSPDPAGTVDGPNLFAYVGGNPVGYNDPTGMAISTKGKKKAPAKPSRFKPKYYQLKVVKGLITGHNELTSVRPQNQETKGEGDHGTAFVTFRHLIFSRTYNKPPRRALRSLKIAAKEIKKYPGYNSGKAPFRARHLAITKELKAMEVSDDQDENIDNVHKAMDLVFELRSGLDYTSRWKKKSSGGKGEGNIGLMGLQKQLMKHDEDEDERYRIMSLKKNAVAINDVHNFFDYTSPLAPVGFDKGKQPAVAPRTEVWVNTLEQHIRSLSSTYYFIYGERGHFSEKEMVDRMKKLLPKSINPNKKTNTFFNNVFKELRNRF